MAINDLYALTVFINSGGSETQMQLGFEQEAGTIGPNTMEATCQAFVTQSLAALLACLSANASVDQIRMHPVTPNNDLRGQVSLTGQFGTGDIEVLPAAMTAVLFLPTVAPNAKHNGRIYLSGCPEDQQLDSAWKAPQLVFMNTFAALLGANLTPTAPEDAEFKPVVISRIVDSAPRVPPVGFDILVPIARPFVRQQRRRKQEHLGVRP